MGKARAKDYASRLTGISTPLFGASWQPTVSEREIAEEVIDRLEDRRVLYNPSEAETPLYCAQSVLQIRQILTDALGTARGKGLLVERLSAMRAACRHFLDRMEREQGPDYEAAQDWGIGDISNSRTHLVNFGQYSACTSHS
jgi:hypothetical protein